MRGRCDIVHRQKGWTMLGLLLVVSVVGTALGQMVVTSAAGVVAARRSRDDLSVRLAVSDILNRRAPDEDGGTVTPDAPLDGWSDVVTVDPESGRIVPYDGGESAGLVLRRQWRCATSDGQRVFAVSVAVVDRRLESGEGPDATEVVLQRSLR
jgi:type II secretory pathway pseudopilin PulG